MVTWGDADWGGDSSHVQDQLYMVSYVCGTYRAFLEIRANGTFLLGDDATCLGAVFLSESYNYRFGKCWMILAVATVSLACREPHTLPVRNFQGIRQQ